MTVSDAIQQYKQLLETDIVGLSGQEVLDAFILARDHNCMLDIGGNLQAIADANTALLRKDLLRRLE